MTNLPLFDCRLPSQALAMLEAPFSAGQLAAGPAIGELERQLSDRFAGRHAVAVSDMTHALALALGLAGVGVEDEVLTLSFNCMSSNSAIAMVGARPIWVDLDPGTASFDVDHARRQITGRTKAVIVYHLAGYPADLGRIRTLCAEFGLPLIEDANNGFGATFEGRPVGTIGDFAVFSLYANRQINAIDGGILLCSRSADAERARRLRRFGIDAARFRDPDGEIEPSLDVPEIGASATLSNINATLALFGLSDVDARLAKTRQNVAMLRDAVNGLAIMPIEPIDGAEPAYWTWLIRVKDRDNVMRALKARGVMCSKLHYPNHNYTGFGAPSSDLPGTKCFQDEMLALPCGWWIDSAEVPRIAAIIEGSLQAAD